MKGQFWNAISPGAPGFVNTIHAIQDNSSLGNLPVIAIVGDCAESAYIHAWCGATRISSRWHPFEYSNTAAFSCDRQICSTCWSAQPEWSDWVLLGKPCVGSPRIWSRRCQDSEAKDRNTSDLWLPIGSLWTWKLQSAVPPCGVLYLCKSCTRKTVQGFSEFFKTCYHKIGKLTGKPSKKPKKRPSSTRIQFLARKKSQRRHSRSQERKKEAEKKAELHEHQLSSEEEES